MSASSTPLGSRRLYLAVDCGGSKAAAAIAISSSQPGQPPAFLSRGFGGAANYTDVGLERFLNSVRQAVEAALDASRIEWRDASASSEDASSPSPSRFAFPALFHAAWLGIAGVDSPLNISVLSPHLSRLLNIPYPSPRLIVANDTSLLASPVIEKDDGLPSDAVREGVVCIAGTGSIVMSFRSGRVVDASDLSADVSPKGEPQKTSDVIDSSLGKDRSASRHARSASSGRLLEAVGRVGGFGWLLGDEGGGYMVGKRAVRAVLDQADRERLGEWAEDARSAAGEGALAPPLQVAGSGSAGVLPPSLLHAQGQPIDRAHLLRDRILAHWHLRSTDDLLDTVYSNEVILQPSKPDLYGAHRASTSSAGSSLLGHGGPSEGGGGGSGRSSIDDGSDATHNAVASEDKTPSASQYIDPSQSLLPPGARQCDGEAVDRKSTPSPIPALHSYPPSPRKQLSVDAAGEPGESPLTVEAAELTRALSVSAAEQAGRGSRGRAATAGSNVELSSLPTIAPPAPTLTSAGTSATATTQEQEQQSALGVRKLRLASLAPLVFHLAFTHNDEISLGILRGEIRLIVDQISLLLQREPRSGSPARVTPDARRVLPSRCTLCLGGSLLGVEGYRDILVEELRARGWQFKRVVHVEDVARRGCEALAKGWEDNEPSQ